MDVRLLGPLEVVSEAKPVQLGGRKQRALLARLLLDPNRAVPVERLVDDLWGEDVPETAVKMVQIHVSQLRKVLPEGAIETRPPGYAAVVEPDAIDLVRFERLREQGHEALAAGEAEAAAGLLREALALWRGPALAEFSEPFARSEGGRLDELHLACLEERIEADLALGRAPDLTVELDGLVERYPLREGLRGQLMLALYRTGRQAEALAAYQSYRKSLDEELGIEPSARLKEIERRMLRQDPDLETRERASTRTLAAAALSGPPIGVETRYVQSGDISIAYQVVGDGPLDLVLVHGWVCSFQPGWERREIASFYTRLSQMGRLIMFDKRGTGLSDRVTGIAPLEQRMDDVRAVMDAVDSERAALLGVSEGGPMVALFAATYPERTSAVVAMGTFARRMWAPDYPIGFRMGSDLGSLVPRPEDWGLPIAREFVEQRAPSLIGDEDAIRWYASYITRGASPGAAGQLALMNQEIDVRHVLQSIHVPALVTYREGEYLRDHTRYMGERIPGARVIELKGSDHLPWEGGRDELLDEIDSFLADIQEAAEPDRILATVLFTDIVGSTAKAAELGDRAWKDLLSRHDQIVRAQIARYRGIEMKTTGDGFFATFDGPARAIRCAVAISQAVQTLGLEVRAGLHTGECEMSGSDVGGIAVHIGARVSAEAGPGEVLVSSTVRDLVAGSGIEFREYGDGPSTLKGVPGEWRLFAVES